MPDTGEPRENLYDIPQAAEYLSVSTKTIRRYIDAGRLTARKVKNVWHIEESVLAPLKGRVGKRGPRPLEERLPITPDFMKKLDETLGEIAGKISSLDGKMNELAERIGEAAPEGAAEDQQEMIDSLVAENEELKAENERLEEAASVAEREMEQARQNGPKDAQVLKNKSEEIEELRATITSNQRGLSLLREELAEYKEQIRTKDTTIKDLKARLLELEQELAEEKRTRKAGGLIIGRRKT